MAVNGVNPAAQAIGNLVPLNGAPAQAAAPAAPADKQPNGDINVALKPGQAANIAFEQPGVAAAGGPGAVPADIKTALGEIKTALEGLVKQLTGLLEKLGGKAPGAAPAAGGPANATPAAGGAANPAQPAA
ncbi:MAG: hypothetical protein FJZ01_17470, partial [Candidatus Sericytochromatia bacterium]|nr:hypothetical protein [Candidatus Tanganyikabacteria bacterium]